jgi:uncharacterized RmlC-like cupin family protein
MKRTLKMLAALGGLALVAALLLHTGLARRAFFELFAYVKGVDVLGPTVVRETPLDSPYQRWLESARREIPVHEALAIDDVATVPLRPWPELGEGVTGLYLRFADYQMSDGRIVELPPGGQSESQRHFYEESVYFLGGRGHTVIQAEDSGPQRVDWSAGSLLAIPLNVRHQHFNDGPEPARMLAVTSFPLVLNLVNSRAFIEENPFEFEDRYDGAADYLERSIDDLAGTIETNFVEDVLHHGLQPLDFRGKGNRSIAWDMAGNSMLNVHVSELPPLAYKKAHRHASDAFILILSGTGFSLAWPEGAYHRRERVDWRAGTLFVPPTYWYHQHLNTGSEPARYLAIHQPEVVRNLGLRFLDQLEVDLEEVTAEWRRALEAQARNPAREER